MTVRTAELLMALIMSAFSAYLVWKSTELNIGWVLGEGPGAGMWPFYLGLLMLGSCIWILANWVRHIGPIATSNEYFFAPGTFKDVAAVALLIFVTLALIEGIGLFGFKGIGFYGALPVFLFVYLRVFGGHALWLTLLLVIAITIGTFLFFEITLQITLPKGMTDSLFVDYIFPLFY